MYSILLTLHSFTRWLILIALVVAIVQAWRGWKSGKPFAPSDHVIRIVALILVHVQLVLGVWLYFISPVVKYFLQNFSEAVSEREVRFFGMEHIAMMVIAVVLITIGSSRAKKKQTDKEKFKTMFVWFLIGLIIILISIPWPFLPFAPDRPYFRIF